ncbi:PaaI family thioesterase [Alphaproteobacteria bacterium LSUCC0684]
MELHPRDPDFEEKARSSFAAQTVMKTLGMSMDQIEPGRAVISLFRNERLFQQQKFIHGGVLAAGLDSACGYSALSLAEKGLEVMTVEFKTSFIAPAGQEKIIFTGRVIKPGRRVIFTEGTAHGLDDDRMILIATMTATMTYVELG